MARISATVEEEFAKVVDEAAAKQGISRSEWVGAACSHLLRHETEGEPDADQVGSLMDRIRNLEVQLADRDQALREAAWKNTADAEVIAGLRSEVGYLRSEVSKLTDKLTPPLLPARSGFWSRVLGGRRGP